MIAELLAVQVVAAAAPQLGLANTGRCRVSDADSCVWSNSVRARVPPRTSVPAFACVAISVLSPDALVQFGEGCCPNRHALSRSGVSNQVRPPGDSIPANQQMQNTTANLHDAAHHALLQSPCTHGVHRLGKADGTKHVTHAHVLACCSRQRVTTVQTEKSCVVDFAGCVTQTPTHITQTRGRSPYKYDPSVSGMAQRQTV